MTDTKKKEKPKNGASKAAGVKKAPVAEQTGVFEAPPVKLAEGHFDAMLKGMAAARNFDADLKKDLATLGMSLQDALYETHKVAVDGGPVKGHLEGPDPVVSSVEMSPEGKMTWTGMPSVKDVQEAEMLLKAAGVETGKKGKAFYVDLQLNPIARLSPTYEETSTRLKVEEHEVDLPWEVRGALEQGTEFCIFKFEEQGKTFYVIMDSESQFEITVPMETRGWGRSRQSFLAPAILFLYKSSSYNDHIIGSNFLVNTTSRNNLLNSAKLVRTWKEIHSPWSNGRLFPLDQDFMPPYLLMDRKPPTFAKGRMLVEDSQLKQVDILNSTLTKGQYVEAHIYNSRVEGSSSVSIEHTTINDSKIEGGRIAIRRCYINETKVRADDSLHLQYTRLNKLDHLYGKNLHVLNKFCFLVMDMPAGELVMTRTSGHEFVLNYGGMYSKPMALKATDEEVRKTVTTVISFDEEGFPLRNRINEDLVDYLTRSVVSRLAIIRMLDDTVALSYELIGNNETYTSIYEP